MPDTMQNKQAAIALDLMGGDGAPNTNIEGCRIALERGTRVLALGTQKAVHLLENKISSPNLATEISPSVIEPEEAPLRAIRNKRDSSVYRGLMAVKEGRAGAFVSGGSTGALVAGGVILLGRAPGVHRPCLGVVIPTLSGKGVFFVDLGASSDVRPHTLVQFAIMGNIYARDVLGWNDPKVSLLNIGREAEKGNAVVRKAYNLLKKAPLSFAGNIEARDVFSGEADVVVADGFTGNVFLKTCEGTAMFLMSAIKREISSGMVKRAAASVLRGAFDRAKDLLDYASYGGAPLMGLAGCVVKCHGSSSGEAIANGIREARTYLEKDVTGTMVKTLASVIGVIGEGE